MAVTKPPEHETELAQLDWNAFRDAARRRLRARLSGFGGQDIEDAVQDVAERMVRFVRRHGMPNTPDGLLIRVVRAVAADMIERRQRDRALQTGDVSTWLGEPPSVWNEDDVLEEYRLIVFHVREYFRLKRAGCLPLADAKANGESLKEHAVRRKLSYARVRKAWSRCIEMVHEAMRKNRLRLAWPTPSKGRASR